MAIKNKKGKKILNSDTGAIFFLLAVSTLFLTISNIFFKNIYHGATINLVLTLAAVLMLLLGIVITIKNRNDYEYKTGPAASAELRSSLEAAVAAAWRDHHHARDQTWKALQLEALLAIALIGVDLKATEGTLKNIPIVGSVLLFLVTISGMMLALHHRDLERRKFRHIMHCEDALGLRPYIDDVGLPSPIYIWDIFAFWKSNSVLFIMRMHLVILIFSLWFIWTRIQLLV